MIRSLIVASAASLALAGAARADCEHFKWSLDRELGWIAAGPAAVAAGGEVTIGAEAYALALAPNAQAGFIVAPERPPKPESFGGVFKVEIESSGTYEISLSKPAWIDVAQADARAKSPDFSGQKDCPAIHKSVKFELAAGPAAIEISNSEGAAIVMTIAPAR